MANSINLNQTFSNMSQVQAYFGENAKIVSYGLASDWTTIDVDHYTFTRSSVYGEETYIVVVEFVGDAKDAPASIVEKVERAIEGIKTFNLKIETGRALDKQFSGEGRYECDTFRNVSCGGAEHTILEFVKHSYRNGVDAIACLSGLGFESPAVMSEAAMGWL